MTRVMIEKSLRDTQNLTIMLKEDDFFSMTGYKVVQSQEKEGFVKCRKVTHNGKPELWYDIAPYDSLDVVLPSMTAGQLTETLSYMARILDSVEKNGFMDMANIPLELSLIFIHRKNRKPFLIYLPLQRQAGQTGHKEEGTRLAGFLSEMKQAVRNHPGVEEEMTEKLRAFMDKDVKTLAELKAVMEEKTDDIREQHTSSQLSRPLYTEVTPDETRVVKEKKGFFSKVFRKSEKAAASSSDHDGHGGNAGQEPQEDSSTGLLTEQDRRESLLLTGMNTPEECVFRIKGQEYKIGKKADSVDGCITCSKAVSRVHCRIAERDGHYSIEDLGSANGTYVNGTRINTGRGFPISRGDRIRIADLEFVVETE